MWRRMVIAMDSSVFRTSAGGPRRMWNGGSGVDKLGKGMGNCGGKAGRLNVLCSPKMDVVVSSGGFGGR